MPWQLRRLLRHLPIRPTALRRHTAQYAIIIGVNGTTTGWAAFAAIGAYVGVNAPSAAK